MRIQNYNQNIYQQRSKNTFKSNLWVDFEIPEDTMIKPNELFSLPSKIADIALGQGLIKNKDKVIAGIATVNGTHGIYLLDKATKLYKKIRGGLENMDDNDLAKKIIEDARKRSFVTESYEYPWHLPDEFLIKRPSNLLQFRPRIKI